MTTDIKVGDTVKITFEAEVVKAHSGELCIDTGKAAGTVWVAREHADVEKVEPPVEVFGPGTIVRDKRERSVWAIGSGGYLRLDGAYGPVKSDMVFTSEDYELHEQ